ncbi:MAG: hypothetical protein D6786_05630 [Gammaproteobacteria bacterium]|nr:MAG: hypothetical protein D6786_05630 [Gammaproteobacteria bacterium]
MDRDFVRKAQGGAPWVFTVIGILLLLAWYPFLRFGLSLRNEGQAAIGVAAIVASLLVYLGIWLRARSALQRFLEDARAGRIRQVGVEAAPIRDPDTGEPFMPEAGTITGYERPRADNHLWWMLLLALLAGAVMHLEPWNSHVLKALLRDPVGAFTHGIPAASQGGSIVPSHQEAHRRQEDREGG